jgi:Flp pilus assembly protein TadD
MDEEARARLLARAVEIHADFADALFLLGKFHFRKASCKQAISSLTHVRRKSKSFPEARFMLGTCHLREGEYALSVEALRSILPFAPRLEVLNNLAVAYIRQGEWTHALEVLSETRSTEVHPVVAANYAIAEFSRGDHAAAIAVLEEAAVENPGDARLRFLMGQVYAALGESEKSRKALTEARRLGVDVEKIELQDSKSWSRWFDIWDPRP